MPGKIILLNGASSSGKSTVARALQTALDGPYWHFSIDHLIAAKVLPKSRIDAAEFPWREMRPQFFDGFHRCVPALAEAGNNLIVEHIVETTEWMDRLLEFLEPFDVYFVGLHCPLPELERRERERGDRRIGEAKFDFETTHAFCLYDLEIVSSLSVEANADSIFAAWKLRQSPSAFERMRQGAPRGIVGNKFGSLS